ncbi:hypothetical protein ABM90_14155 [Rhodococcus erythropolis]|nr:hypothetical protein ABM90_14155 [Rhodococcus erythropolis]
MAVELATAYVSLIVDTKQVPGQVRAALGQAERGADATGKNIGTKMSTGIASALKAGAIGSGLAVGGLLAASLVKGMGRLTAIDTAEGKLRGLGHSTQSTAKIMDSALASVKGTAFGLGDAATVAASAVAAGIAPGKELTKYLSLTGDAATIAGSSLSEMGSIFNQVQASGTVYTDTLNQLSDRGIPILQWLQAEYGVTAEALAKMVKGGEVDSATFMKVISENIGGAALESGNTVVGAFENVKAAMGRLGAAALGPGFERLPGQMSSITTALDDTAKSVGPLAKAFDHLLFDVMLPENFDAGKMLSGLTSSVIDQSTYGINKFSAWITGELPGLVDQGKAKVSELLSLSGVDGSWNRIVGVFNSLLGTVKSAGPAVVSIAASLAAASGALGVSAWDGFLSALEASASILNATLVPALNLTAGLLRDNQGAVVALAAGWLLFKTIPAIMGRVTSSLAPITAGMRSANTATSGYRAALGAIRGDFRNLAPQIGVTGAAMRALGNNSSTIRGMQNAFMGASSATSGFASAMRVGATPAVGALKASVGGVVNALGGPLAMGLMAATVAFVNYKSGVAKATNQNRILADSVTNAASAQADLMKAMVAGDEASISSQVVSNLRSLRQEQASLASTGPSFIQKSVAGWESLSHAMGITRGETASSTLAQEDAANTSKAVTATLDGLKITNEDLGRAVTGSSAAFDALRGRMLASGDDSKEAVEWLDKQRASHRLLQLTMEAVGPAGVEIAGAISQIADSAGDSKSKLDGLTTVLQALGILETDTQSAMFDAAEAVRELAKAAEEGVDPVGGLGDALVGLDGGLDPEMPNAKALRDSLIGLSKEFANLIASGLSSKDAAAELEGGLQSLADMYDLPIEKVRELAQTQGLLVDKRVDITMAVDGRDEASEALSNIAVRADEFQGDRTITMTVKDQAAIDAITNLNLGLLKINETTGEVEITAESDAALAGIGAVVVELGKLDKNVATPKITADQTAFFVADADTRQKLSEIDRTQVDPKVGLVLDQFSEGRNVTLAELQKIDLTTASPDVQLIIKDAIANAQVVNAEITNAARNRTSVITIDVQRTAAAQAAFNGTGQYGPVAPVFNSRGSRLPKNSAGSRLPTSGPGTSTTDGILGIGYDGVPTSWVDKGEWIINGRSSEKYNGLLAAINRDDPRLNTLPKFAEGGRNGITDALAAGASVDGNKYAWGGTGPTNFDCSGFVGWLQQIVMGVTGSVKRLYTTYNLLGSSGVAGLQQGLGPAGTQFQVGVSEEHMAATIGGHSAESGGAHGTSGLDNGRANAQSSQFPFKWHLPNSMIAGWNEAQGTSIGATSEVTWTDKQELDLQSADIAVQQAKEARDKVYGDEKKSQADRDQADVKVRQAEQKVIDLQAKKDEAGTGKKGPSPQAPELSKAYTDAEIERLEAQMQVDDANERRNDVYADAEASPNDRLRADIALQEAKDALVEVGKGKQETGGKDYSLNGILKSFGHNAVDALFTGLQGQDYFGIGESRWLSTDFADLMGKPAIPAPTPATFTQAEIDAQTGGMSAAEILERWGVKAPKVFDDGGWLMPGEMGINLSQRPEPIFNSPGQLQAFAGSTLAPAAAAPQPIDASINFHAPVSTNNLEEFKREMRFESKVRSRSYSRR